MYILLSIISIYHRIYNLILRWIFSIYVLHEVKVVLYVHRISCAYVQTRWGIFCIKKKAATQNTDYKSLFCI